MKQQQSICTDAPSPDSTSVPCTERRTLLRVAGLTGVVGAVGVGLAACGGSSPAPAGTEAQNPAAPTAGSGTSAAGAPSTQAGQAGQGTELAATSKIPVGGGLIFPNQKVVVTQPAAGTFKAFSSTCTHMGCQVNQVTNGLIECPCHGSQYSIADGSVKAGPAPRPLPSEPITVQGGQIFLSA